ncbi:MAG: amidase [Spirochaetaceae bacterium]
MAYDLTHPRAPRLSGALLEAVAALLERPILGKPIAKKLLTASGIDRFRHLHVPEPPRMHPTVEVGEAKLGETPSDADLATMFSGAKATGFRFPSVSDYAEAYREGRMTPSEVAERIIRTLNEQDRGDPPLYLFVRWNEGEIRAQAEESSRRYREGNPRSLLEGIPIPIKDEVDVAGYPTSLGTSFLTTKKAEKDATVVARLRAAGAIILGKANMHEIGIGVTGLNPNYGTPINPYAPWRYPGGSSSGSAAAVALGLVPVAVGADGGGSIRIPAAFCGIAGLKATYGRVSGRGAGPLVWSVGHLGPLAASVADLAILYAHMAGPDELDPWTLGQPPLELGAAPASLEGMRLGIYTPWFEDASEDVLVVARSAVQSLTDAGAQVVEIDIPELENLRVAHLLTIVTEQKAAIERYYEDHRTDFGIETRTALALAGRLTGSDYIKAQQVRERGLRQWRKIFASVDVVVTPTTAVLPPKVPEDRLLSGVSDLSSLSEIMRYTPVANLLGFPAISVPAGFVTAHSRHFLHTQEERDHEGKVYSEVPVGLHFMAPHWEEGRLLRLGAAMESMLDRPRPRVYFPTVVE